MKEEEGKVKERRKLRGEKRKRKEGELGKSYGKVGFGRGNCCGGKVEKVFFQRK